LLRDRINARRPPPVRAGMLPNAFPCGGVSGGYRPPSSGPLVMRAGRLRGRPTPLTKSSGPCSVPLLLGSGLPIESIHHRLDPLGEPGLDGLDERRQQLLDYVRVRFSEFTQDVIGQVAAVSVRRRRDANPEAGVVLMPERAFDAL